MIKKTFPKVVLILLAAISTASFVTSSFAAALPNYDTMSTSDQVASYSYYKSMATCIQKSNLDRDIDQNRINDPKQWINEVSSNSQINTGFVINDGKDTNGTAYCRDIIAGALSLWQVTGEEFLKGIGYTLKADGTQMNAPSDNRLPARFDQYISGATSTKINDGLEFSLGLAALTATQDGCSATKVGLFKDQDAATQRMASSNANNFFTLISPTEQGGTVSYVFKRNGNASTNNSYLPGGDNGNGTACDKLIARMNQIARPAAQAIADKLYITLSNNMFSSLKGLMNADCGSQPNNGLRQECRDGWQSTFNSCFNTTKSTLAATGQNNADGSDTPLYIIPDAKSTSDLSRCIAKGTGASLAEINKALVAAIANTPVPSTTDQVEKLNGPKATSTCGVDGIGWMICPIADSVAKGVDGIFNVVKSFLEFKSYSTRTDSGIYPAWSVMRNFANVAFVIAFMIIIYSQLTSVGMSNYGIKKMLPRLIVAAILVNISYWICGIAVDLSNILGSTLNSLFTGLIPTVAAKGVDVSWGNATSSILAGTAIAGVSAAIGIAGAGSFYALLWMLVPMLLAALFSIFVAVVVLAGRQVLIIIFIVISPLAFVAYLLPNTQKWYEKWQGVLMTLLLMYPIIAVIFGGSQFAAAIIRSAPNLDMTMVILSLAVQVIPLAITPLVIKFSGGLLGRFAGMVNNPKRGPIDGLKNWAKDRQGLATKRGLGSENPNFVNRMGQFRDRRRRTREGFAKANEMRAESMWQRTEQGSSAIDAQGIENIQSEIDKNTAGTRLKAVAPLDLTLKARATKLQLDVAQASEDALVKAAGTQASNPVLDGIDSSIRRDIQSSVLAKTIADSAGTMAQSVQNQEYADKIKNSDIIAQAAGGVAPRGVAKVRANASATRNAATSEAIKHAVDLLQDTRPENLITEAQQSLIDANASGDVVQARAAAQVLRSTGAKGLSVLHDSILTMEATGGVHSDVVDGLKYDTSAAGVKGKDSAMDMWATSTGTLASHNANGNTVSRLNQVELAGQGTDQLEYWASRGIMTKDQANSVIAAYKSGTLPLDEKKLAIFNTRAGRP